MEQMQQTEYIDWNNPVFIDAETFYDTNDFYTLGNPAKLTNEEYIRDARFELIGWGIRANPSGRTVFFPAETGIDYLRKLAETNRPFVSHNAQFDMGILGLRYGVHPRAIADTVVMARLSGLGRVLGSNSLATCAEYLLSKGIITELKGHAVSDMNGKHLADIVGDDLQAYADYCKNDVDILAALYHHLLPLIPTEEMEAISVVNEMFTHPAIELDRYALETRARFLAKSRGEHLDELAVLVGEIDGAGLLSTLRSAAKLKGLLERLGVEAPEKVSARTGKTTTAFAKTDKDFLALLEHEDPLVVAVVDAKLNHTSSNEKSRLEKFQSIASRGVLPAPFIYAGAHTGRLAGGGKINLQNLPKRGGKDLTLRRSLTAPEGSLWVACDSSQIEARLLAYIAGQDDMLQTFLKKRDPYIEMATAIFGKSYDDIYKLAKVEGTLEGKTMRNIGKEAVLACGYGMSARTFALRMELSGNHEAARMAGQIVDAYRWKNVYIKQFWRLCDDVLRVLAVGGTLSFGGEKGDLFYADGASKFFGKTIPSIRLPNGVHLFYEGMRMQEREGGGVEYVYKQQVSSGTYVDKRIWGASLTENVTQALAFAVLKWQMLHIRRAGIPIHLNVHDEWASVVTRKDAPRAMLTYFKAMQSVPSYLPAGLLDCELDIGKNYADLNFVDMNKVINVTKTN